MEKTLESIYLDPSHPASFGGLDAVYRAVKEKGKSKISRKQVQYWLSQQDVYTLHKPARRHYKRSRVIVPGIDAQFQADLVDVQNLSRYNKGYKYLLTCIDIFSKYAWVVPLKTKQGQELVKAFQTILASRLKPSKLQTDQGTEFLNRVFQKFLRENNIDFFTVNSGLKASVVERFNRTFKNKMYKYFTAKNTLSYIDVLPQLVKSYNNTYHRSIKMKPSQVTKANEVKVWDTLYGSDVQKRVRFKFQRLFAVSVSFSLVRLDIQSRPPVSSAIAFVQTNVNILKRAKTRKQVACRQLENDSRNRNLVNDYKQCPYSGVDDLVIF